MSTEHYSPFHILRLARQMLYPEGTNKFVAEYATKHRLKMCKTLRPSVGRS
jgi:hypothetical protein